MMASSTTVQFKSALVYDCDKDCLKGLGLKHDRLVGEGVSGHVILAKDNNFTPRAVKIIPKRKDKQAEREERFAREVSILSALNHPNVIGDVSAARCPTYYAISMPYYPNGSLERYLIKGQPLPSTLLNRYTLQLASVAKYLHSCFVFHSDIKLDNILVKNNGDLVLIDFGNSEILSSASQNVIDVYGTEPYIPPEVDGMTEVDPFKADMFAVGVVIWCLVTGRDANDYEQEHFLPLLKSAVAVTSTYKTIVKSLIELDPEARWSAQTLCQRLKESDLSIPGEMTHFI